MEALRTDMEGMRISIPKSAWAERSSPEHNVFLSGAGGYKRSPAEDIMMDVVSLSSPESATTTTISIACDESVCSEPSSATTFAVNDMLYTPVELRAMADELDLAHRAGEFPTTKFLNHNPQITVDDYKRLLEIREAAGSGKNPSQATLALVSVTRDIRERDAELEERIEHDRVLRHVNSCMRAVQEEERLYRIMQTALSQNTHVATKNDLEHVASKHDLTQIEQCIIASKLDLQRVEECIASKQDLRNVVSLPLHRDIDQLAAHVNLISRQLDMMHATLHEIKSLQGGVADMQTSISGLPGMIQQTVQESIRIFGAPAFGAHLGLVGIHSQQPQLQYAALAQGIVHPVVMHKRQMPFNAAASATTEPSPSPDEPTPMQEPVGETGSTPSTTSPFLKTVGSAFGGSKRGIYKIFGKLRRETVDGHVAGKA